MQIKHHNSNDDGIFYLDDNGKRMGDMRYLINANNTMDVYHTEVAKEIEGQSWGKQLVEAAVKYARQNNLKIVPTCTFAQSVFAGTPKFQDVLA